MGFCQVNNCGVITKPLEVFHFAVNVLHLPGGLIGNLAVDLTVISVGVVDY